MRDVAKEGTAGIVGSCKIVTVMKEPSGACVGGQVLVGPPPAPPWKVLYGLELCRDERIRVGLLEAAFVDRGVALVLKAPPDVIDHAGKCVCAVPLAQLDPAVRPVREKI